MLWVAYTDSQATDGGLIRLGAPTRQILGQQKASAITQMATTQQVVEHGPAQRRVAGGSGQIGGWLVEDAAQGVTAIREHGQQIELALEAHQVGRSRQQVGKLGIQ